MLDGDEVRDGDAGVERSARAEEERCWGLRTAAVAAATRQRGEGREEELGLGLLGHEVQAGMDTGDADEIGRAHV